jgi:hypothetical protein
MIKPFTAKTPRRQDAKLQKSFAFLRLCANVSLSFSGLHRPGLLSLAAIVVVGLFSTSEWIRPSALSAGEGKSVARNQNAALTLGFNTPSAQLAKTEGCITCHGQIEPMHKYGPT